MIEHGTTLDDQCGWRLPLPPQGEVCPSSETENVIIPFRSVSGVINRHHKTNRTKIGTVVSISGSSRSFQKRKQAPLELPVATRTRLFTTGCATFPAPKPHAMNQSQREEDEGSNLAAAVQSDQVMRWGLVDDLHHQAHAYRRRVLPSLMIRGSLGSV